MEDIQRFGEFELNLQQRTLCRGGAEVDLSPRCMAVLMTLAQADGEAVSRNTLVDRVWAHDEVTDNAINFTIHKLRRSLQPDGDKFIETVPGIGYRLRLNPPFLVAADSAGVEDIASTVAPNSSKKATLIWGIAIGGFLLTLTVLIGALISRRYAGMPLVSKYKQLTNDGRPKISPVRDGGGRIWFQEQIEGKWTIVSVSEGGGEAVPIELPFEAVRLLDIATDGSALLLCSVDRGETKLWAWPLGGGMPQLLPALPCNAGAGWSPDKRMIAFGEGSALGLGSGDRIVKQIAMPVGTEVHDPRWSPDGAHVAFGLVNKKIPLTTLSFWNRFTNEAHSDTTGSADREDQPDGTWTKDGRYYLFAAGHPQRHDLWAIPISRDLRTSHLAPAVRLTNGPFDWTWPVTSQTTGQLLAIGEVSRGELVRLAWGEKDWHPYLGGISAYEMDFSRDGKKIAFTHFPDHRLWTAQADGTDRVQLAWPDFDAHMPHWSPDGTRIAFMGQKPGKPWRVMIVQVANGLGEEPVPAGEDQGVPSWSKDGSSLVYGEWPSANHQKKMKLHLLDLKRKIVTTLEGSDGLWTVRWSPDGTYLAALRQDSKGIVLSRPGVPEWREILRADNIDDLTWSWDSKYLYLTASDPRELLRVDVSQGSVEKIADIHAFSIRYEHWFGAAKDGSPLALRGTPGQEIYAVDWIAP